MVSNWASVLAGIATTLTSLLGAVHALPTSNTAAVAHALAPGVTDTVTITDKAGTGETNYPLQFGRPFVQGEIANFPQVLINGTPVQTQADVKNRYPDGSVKFAIISVVVPSIGANGSLTLSFQNQSTGNNTALTKTQMLASNFNFDAGITIADTAGHSASASARTMLQNGDYTVWTSGPVATTILLADDSVNRKYDIGFDSYKSVRPRFYATFWPATNQVTVRYVGENSNTETLEDLAYNLTLTIGNTNPQTVYTQAIHNLVGQRWTKQYWLNGTPEQKININHNVGYLAATILIPNYDPSPQIPEDTIAHDYLIWQGKSWEAEDTTIGGYGFWNKYMPQPGARGDIGPMPAWTVKWIYSGDWREKEIAFGNADLASSWGVNIREGDPAKFVDKAQTVPGLGKPINAYGRPTVWLFDARQTPAPEDDVQIIGSRMISATYPDTEDGWEFDGAHQPDAFYGEYLLSGDYYYLEEMQFWAGTDSLAIGQCAGSGNYWCRGPGAGIFDQVRGEAWVLRNRVNPAAISPDNDPLKDVYSTMVDDALARYEGQRNITGTSYEGNPMWQFGYNQYTLNPYGNPPLHFWGAGPSPYPDYTEAIDPTKTAGYVSNWMEDFVIIELGRAKELGFKSGALLSYLAPSLIGEVTDPGFNKWLVSGYRIPSMMPGNPPRHFQTWAEVLAAYLPDYQNATGFVWNVCNSCVTGMVHAASAYLYGQPNGAQAISNLNDMIAASPTIDFNPDPTWDILPRTNGATLPPPTTYVPPPATPTASLNATSTSITTGQSATLTWSSTNATSCTGTGFTTNGTSGSVSVTPTQTTTYSITCTGTGGSANASATVTVGPPADTVTPTISLSVATSTTSSTVTLNATASDATGVTQVEFYVDGTLINTDVSAPYSYAWNTSSIANGSHSVSAKAYDAAGNVGTSASVTVNVQNAITNLDTTPPSISITYPSSGATVSGTVNVTASASDNVEVTKVEFIKDGTVTLTDSVGPYVWSWHTTDSFSGTHALSVRAYDAANNVGTSNQITVTVQNTISNPQNNPTPQGYTHSASSTAPRLGRTLRIGSTGSDVQQLQQYLNAIGFTVTVPGQETTYYGSGTAAAVSRFQEAHAAEILIPNGLTSGTGVVGPTTIAVISGTAPAVTQSPVTQTTPTVSYSGRLVKYGFSGNDIAILQRQLVAAGYLKVGSDSGYFGTLTRAAVRKFQCDRGLVCSGDEISTGWGLVGARTRAALPQ